MSTSGVPNSSLDSQYGLDQQSEQIAEIIEREQRRRRRTLYVLLSLLLVTTALAAAVLAFGRTERQVIKKTTEETVTRQITAIVAPKVSELAPPLINDAVNKHLPPAMNEKLTPMVNDAINNNLESRVSEEVSSQVEPKIEDLESKMLLYGKANTQAGQTGAAFTAFEAQGIKRAVSQELPKQANLIKKLFGQVDEIAAVSNAARRGWSEDEPEIRQQLSKLEHQIKESQESLASFSNKINLILETLNGNKDPCAQTLGTRARTYTTYSIKENSKAEIYDMGLQISLKGQTDGKIRSVTVYRGDKKIYGPEDIMMGHLFTFEDDKYQYSLIPIFINRRRLANDFIGLAISRNLKCPKLPEK